MSTGLLDTLRIVAETFEKLEGKWALIGGLAISVYVEPRFTRDIDVVVSVENDLETEDFVRSWRACGFIIDTVMEQDASGRLATVRSYRSGPHGIVVDLLFASSGIEPELVASAMDLEILPGLIVPVARPAHLVALKALAVDPDLRPQDVIDLKALGAALDENEHEEAFRAVDLIARRGYDRDRDLRAILDQFL